jgi:hypothetical protein
MGHVFLAGSSPFPPHHGSCVNNELIHGVRTVPGPSLWGSEPDRVGCCAWQTRIGTAWLQLPLFGRGRGRDFTMRGFFGLSTASAVIGERHLQYLVRAAERSHFWMGLPRSEASMK